MPKKTILPLSLYSSYNFSTAGIDCLQGGHHEAQKSTKTTLPLKSEKESQKQQYLFK
jgi:hypothetical protein